MFKYKFAVQEAHNKMTIVTLYANGLEEAKTI